MRIRPTAVSAAVLCLLSVSQAPAHVLDEYLQATTISLGKERIRVQLRLTPGSAVFPVVFAGIDTDASGAISDTEQHIYAEAVLRDLSLTVDGKPLHLRLISSRFAGKAEMKQGLGEIEFDFAADVPRRPGPRKLVFENHHQSRVGAYLVNCLLPSDSDIQVMAQTRSYTQSFYRLDYVQAGNGFNIPRRPLWLLGPGGTWAWFGGSVLFLIWLLALLSPKRGTNAVVRQINIEYPAEPPKSTKRK